MMRGPAGLAVTCMTELAEGRPSEWLQLAATQIRIRRQKGASGREDSRRRGNAGAETVFTKRLQKSPSVTFHLRRS